jgi:hypothetical protein
MLKHNIVIPMVNSIYNPVLVMSTISLTAVSVTKKIVK